MTSSAASSSARLKQAQRTQRSGRQRAVASAIAGEEWTSGEALPLGVLRIGEQIQLACNPAVITMIVPLPQRFKSCSGMLDLAEGLGITLPEDDPFSGTEAVVSAERAWQQLELCNGEVDVVVPEPPSVQPVPRACIARLPGLLSDPTCAHGSAIDGVLGLIRDAPGLAPIVWLVDLPVLAKQLLVALGVDEAPSSS